MGSNGTQPPPMAGDARRNKRAHQGGATREADGMAARREVQAGLLTHEASREKVEASWPLIPKSESLISPEDHKAEDPQSGVASTCSQV